MRYVDPCAPVDETCLRCDEEIEDGDTAAMVSVVGAIRWMHIECQMIGIIGHDYGVCRCKGFDTTSHEAALELQHRVIGRRKAGQW